LRSLDPSSDAFSRLRGSAAEWPSASNMNSRRGPM